jgi:molybdopterin molybdotransferase
VIPVEQALARVFDLCPVLPAETVRLSDALGRVLAEPVRARRDQPPFAASAMDGYALAGDGPWQVVGEAAAGAASDRALAPGEALRIFTGAAVPPGADRVLIQENARREGARLSATDLPPPGANIRPAGQDFRAGDTLCAPRLLRPVDLGLIAAMDHPELRVMRRPVVAVISTGDELVHPGEAARPDQITASNGYALQAMAREAGAEARLLPIARDTRAHLRAVLDMARDADVIVTSGGASVGDHDLVAPVLAEMGAQMAFHKLALRPGKPLMAGRLGAALVLGLPGNPVSAIVCAHLFLLPALRAMLGLGAWPAPTRTATLGCDLPANGPRAHYMRATLEPGGTIRPMSDQDSARLGLMAQADALLIRPIQDPARAAGAEMRYIPL